MNNPNKAFSLTMRGHMYVMKIAHTMTKPQQRKFADELVKTFERIWDMSGGGIALGEDDVRRIASEIVK